jgi:lysozyme
MGVSIQLQVEKNMQNKFAEMIIAIEESFRSKPYYCSEHFPTIGYGERVGDKNAPLPNITRTEKEAREFLRKRIQESITKLSTQKPLAWSKCNEQRQAILVSMVYQQGMTGVLNFKKMWAAIEVGNFEEASKQMLDSLWAKQTPKRALRHAKTMKDGSLDMYYISAGVLQ